MSGLISKPKTPEVEEPATMPDEMDQESIRKQRGKAARRTGTSSNRVARTGVGEGREYSRGTLG